MDLSLRRIADGILWRLTEAEARLPVGVRRQIDRQRVNARVRNGQFNFDVERLINSYTRAWQILLDRGEAKESLGDFLEFGVFYGSSLACMHSAKQALALPQVRLFGFDSFEGLPESASKEDLGLWHQGQFASSLETTREFLARSGVPASDVELIKGWFNETASPETARKHQIRKASIIMIDCDLYSSTTDALTFCEPLIDGQAIIYFDDWNAGGLANRGLGERRAFEELLERCPELWAEELPELEYKSKQDPKTFLVTRR